MLSAGSSPFRGILYEQVKNGCFPFKILTGVSPERHNVYRIWYPMLNGGPYVLRPQLHNIYNQKLCIELIEIIVSYLSDQDLFHLAISKLFLPALLTMPKFFFAMGRYFGHTLCTHFNNKHNLFIKCAYIPYLFNNNLFYVAEDTQAIAYLKKYASNIDKGIPLEDITLYFTMIFNSYNSYLDLASK